ncbi:alginate lyase family protein [Maribellus sp. CM-23]|uniref:alginate lyase family protein n=1 Tax=Maribellus sp. CM-23 TaxID=2781026 RepID=UPI001F46544A|nr:alginate lyase family protein [Maribellus sp. CM-23]MCE4566482.1 alginate lyase family protein [Maribellus sp. CM-23]
MWRKATGFRYPLSIEKKAEPLIFTPWIDKPASYESATYTFLNQSVQYPSAINWGESKYGKLWAYNLNYMDYLLQANMDIETGNQLIQCFISDLPQNPTGLEPYPIALRGINWIKFLSRTSLRGGTTTRQSDAIPQINNSLYAQYLILLDNLEYHLMGNHLLEDAFSLLFGAFYFKEQRFWEVARRLLIQELEEQLLDDGAHFELSPMYHQILLDRLLDCINLVQNNTCFDEQDKLLVQLKQKAEQMLTWLNTITLSDGRIPLLNDSAPGIAPTTGQLNEYAKSLNIEPVALSEVEGWNFELKDSGYRRYNGTNYECIIDIEGIKPGYQPGHAHADTFNFILNVNHQPFLIDTGISTYESNAIRLAERGTPAHNTVAVNERNSSQVWSSFRVAQRANVKVIKEEKNRVTATHDGFRSIGTSHQRSWQFDEQAIKVEDVLTGSQTKGTAYFHVSPTLKPIRKNNEIWINDTCISFEGAETISLIKAQLPNGYNQSVDYYKLEVVFQHKLTTFIKIRN